jgi:hypothetical protein
MQFISRTFQYFPRKFFLEHPRILAVSAFSRTRIFHDSGPWKLPRLTCPYLTAELRVVFLLWIPPRNVALDISLLGLKNGGTPSLCAGVCFSTSNRIIEDPAHVSTSDTPSVDSNISLCSNFGELLKYNIPQRGQKTARVGPSHSVASADSELTQCELSLLCCHQSLVTPPFWIQTPSRLYGSRVSHTLFSTVHFFDFCFATPARAISRSGGVSCSLMELSLSKSGCGNRYAWCTLYCDNGTVAVQERLREPLRQCEAALVRGWYITRYSICVWWCHQL